MDEPLKVTSLDPDVLDAIGINPDEISKATAKQLVALEGFLSEMERRRGEAKAFLEEDGLSIRAVAKGLGISRTTIHTNPVLKEYLLRRRDAICRDDAKARISELEEELAEARSTIDAMRQRDAEIVLLRHKLSMLERQSDRQMKYIERQAERSSPNLSLNRKPAIKGIVNYDDIR